MTFPGEKPMPSAEFPAAKPIPLPVMDSSQAAEAKESEDFYVKFRRGSQSELGVLENRSASNGAVQVGGDGT